jgi:flagella basal body P-ring formation protein FlgA
VRLLALLLCAAALWAEAPLSPTERLVETALAFAKQEGEKFGGEHRFKLAQAPRLPQVGAGALTFEASHLSKREPMGRFFVVVALLVKGQRVGMVRVDLDGTWAGNLLRAKGDLVRKAVLTEDLVEADSFEGVPPEGALTELPMGQRLMRAVPSGRILTRGDLESIPLIQSGDRVRLTATYEYLNISLDTIARSRGALGDRVRLEAPGSHRTLTAVITGPGAARMQN